MLFTVEKKRFGWKIGGERSSTSFIALFPRVVLQSQLFLTAPLATSISLPQLLFGFSSHELTIVSRVFVYLPFILKYYISSQRNDFRLPFRCSQRYGIVFLFTYLYSFKRIALAVDVAISFASGKLIVLSVQLGIPPLLSTYKYI